MAGVPYWSLPQYKVRRKSHIRSARVRDRFQRSEPVDKIIHDVSALSSLTCSSSITAHPIFRGQCCCCSSAGSIFNVIGTSGAPPAGFESEPVDELERVCVGGATAMMMQVKLTKGFTLSGSGQMSGGRSA